MIGNKGVLGNICSILVVYILIVSYYTAKATDEGNHFNLIETESKILSSIKLEMVSVN